MLGCILSEEFIVCHRSCVEHVVVVSRAVEKFTISWVHLRIVLGALDRKVLNPAQFSINVSFLSKFGIVGHASSFNFVLFIRV